jgi:hypothetical protein
MSRFLTSPETAPIHLHIGDPERCLEFLVCYPECFGRITELTMRATHTQNPAQWMKLWKRFAWDCHQVRSLDMFWAAPTEPWSFPRCGPNPWGRDQKVLEVLGSIRVMASSRVRSPVKMGGLFTDSSAAFLKRKMGGEIGLYLPTGYEHPTIFFSLPEDVDRNNKILDLTSLFTFTIDVSEPTSLSKFLDKHPCCSERFNDVRIRIYDKGLAQDWIDLFKRLARKAVRLDNIRMWWDQDTEGSHPFSQDEGVLESLASINFRHTMELVGQYSPLCVSYLEGKMGTTGYWNLEGNYALRWKWKSS